jgi:hypothetical protein
MSEPSDQPLMSRRGCWFFAVLVVVILAGGLYYAFHVAWQYANQMNCANRCTQIALAMHNYAQTYRSFPPAYTTDRNGRPLHSWRVLLLPYIEQETLYKKIRLNEPWDSPHNSGVLQRTILTFYHCPSAPSPETDTNYVMVVGPAAISDGPHSVGFGDIKDGTSNTIMFVEIKNGGIHWAEPCDLDFGSMSFRVNDPNGRGIGSYHPGGAFVKLADASGRFIADDFDPKLLKALITINGGEDGSGFFRNKGTLVPKGRLTIAQQFTAGEMDN